MLIPVTRVRDGKKLMIAYEGINYAEPHGDVTRIVMKGGKAFDVRESPYELNSLVESWHLRLKTLETN